MTNKNCLTLETLKISIEQYEDAERRFNKRMEALHIGYILACLHSFGLKDKFNEADEQISYTGFFGQKKSRKEMFSEKVIRIAKQYVDERQS